MKIATFNVNNVNKRLGNLLDWLKATRPDVACLQELKATDSEFPVAAIEKPVTARSGGDRSHGMASPYWRVTASLSSHTLRYPVIPLIHRAATSRRLSMAC
jgi:exonuclease III